jgi:glycosyltransferase involved in cell wall biosynthesis
MAMKKAVITAKVPSVMDYVEDGVDALLYEPKNAIDLADKMKYLITHNDICRKISEQAYLSVRNRMNEREMADKIERFLFDSMI